MKNIWVEHRSFVAYAVCVLALAEQLDLSIVVIALPQIMGSIGANIDQIAMINTSYLIMVAIFTPMTGLFLSKFGIKSLTIFSAIIFVTASILCAMSTSLYEMVFFRIIQGIGGACLTPIAQTYIIRKFAHTEQTKMMTIHSICVVLGPVIGPTLGGVLTAYFSWRWCFFVNVPLCIISIIVILVYMKEQVTENIKADYISFIFMGLGLGCFEYFIDQGSRSNWLQSITMIIILAISIICILFFTWRGLLGKSVINFALFKHKNFIFANIVTFLVMSLSAASIVYLPTMLQQVYGYPSDTAAYATVPCGLSCIAAVPIVTLLMGKIDARAIMAFGILLLSTASFILSSFGSVVNQAIVISVSVMQGFAIIALFVPMLEIIFIGLSEKLQNDGSGVFSLFRCMASSVGTSFAATIIAHQQQISVHELSINVSPYSTPYALWAQRLGNTSEQVKAAIANDIIIDQSYLIGFLDVFHVCGVLLLMLVWIPFVLKRPQLAMSTVSHLT